MIKCAIFDLDGTLVNTIDDLGAATAWVMKQFGIEGKWGEEDYKRFVGNGAKKLVDRAFEGSLSDDELEKAYNMFRKKYNEIKLDNAYPYDGIVAALTELKDKGIKLAVVTNKPDEAAQGMVKTIFGDNMFDAIVGIKEGIPTKPNPASVNAVLNTFGCTKKEAIYFGDSDTDIVTARNAGVEGVGCSWGFRSFEVLFKENPSVIIDEPKFITKLF